MPTIPTTLSLRTFQQIQEFFSKQDYAPIKILPFFVMVDRRKQIHRQIVDEPPAFMSGVLQSSIPYASEIERMGIQRTPVSVFAHRSKAARSYLALWQEIQAII